MAELVACIGADATIRLIEARGGGRVHVPIPARADASYLAGVIGQDETRKLAAAMGGTRIDVPLCREWRVRLLLHEGGRSQAEIARKIGVALNTVRRLAHTDWTRMPTHKAKRGDRVDAQMDMFSV